MDFSSNLAFSNSTTLSSPFSIIFI